MRNLLKTAAVAAISLLTLPASAVPFSATLADAIGPISGTGLLRDLTSPGQSAIGGATLTFDLIGYGGIDGFGPRISLSDVYDNFGFRVNDPGIDGVSFVAILNMGGSYPGAPILLDPSTSTFDPPYLTLVSYTDNAPGGPGGLAQFSVAFTLLNGFNEFAFNFGHQPGVGEGWGLRNLVVTAELLAPQPPINPNAVPEPITLTLLGAGLAGIGGMRRRR